MKSTGRASGKPVRILHVVAGMNRGGVETWLMHLLRHIDRDRYRMDFLVHATERCAYDDEIKALGSKILRVPDYRRPVQFANAFRKILRQAGPYDVVHSHVHHYSGWVLRLASGAGVPIRIAHSHSDTSHREKAAGFTRRRYLSLMKHWIASHATLGLACSRRAAAALFDEDRESQCPRRVLYCGLDPSGFPRRIDDSSIRSALGLPPNAFVIGHVGRFTEAKNHPFVVAIAAEAVRLDPRTHLLLVGDGPLRPRVEQKVKHEGLGDRVVFTGARSDVASLITGAMDVFLMPSLFEGLPLAAVEAQAAALPCFFSAAVPAEADVVPALIRRIDLSRPAGDWARAILQVRRDSLGVTPAGALALLENSPFNIHRGIQVLGRIYRGHADDCQQTGELDVRPLVRSQEGSLIRAAG